MVLLILAMGLLYALPSIYGQDPAIDISGTRKATVGESLQATINTALEAGSIPVKAQRLENGRLLMRFTDPEQQLKAQKVIADTLPQDYTYALTLAADVPGWLIALGGKPMSLGLDLRGGIHVLIDVDMDAALSDKMEIEASLLERTKTDKEQVAKENENLRVRVAQLQEKPDARIARDLEILARAEKAMLVNAPGFAPAWENAKTAAAEEVTLEDQGKSLPKRLFHKLFGSGNGGGEVKAIEAETVDDPAEPTTASTRSENA